MPKTLPKSHSKHITKETLVLLFVSMFKSSGDLNRCLCQAEYRFHPVRRWRFDWAFPDQKIAIEWEGITSFKSGHLTLGGYTANCEKYNWAAILGWKVIRVTALMEQNQVIAMIMAAFPDQTDSEIPSNIR
jgi:hypothetical protein